MSKTQNSKQYDLEERTFEFAKNCRKFVNKLPRTIGNFEDRKQLIRSSGSIAANYIEANESLSKKDFAMRIKICRKEAKESFLWLSLCNIGENDNLNKEEENLLREARELTNIFGSIVEKCK